MIIKKKYKLGRRLGAGVIEKCQTQKFMLSETRRKPRMSKHPKKRTDYGNQLIEKQRVRFMYGISEKQFRRYVDEASSKKGLSPIEELYSRLENRLDNIIYRSNVAVTRRLARQLVSHGHILLNGKRVTVPSAEVRAGDIVSIRPQSQKAKVFEEVSKKMSMAQENAWFKIDSDKKEIKIQAKPKKTEVDSFINLNAVFEYYSR